MTGSSPLVWFPGVGWDETPGTDRRIVEEIARTRTVVWIDPPNRAAWRGWWTAPARATAHGIIRIRVPATVGVTRWPMRSITALLRYIALRRAFRLVDAPVVVVANPLASLPRSAKRRRILYVTDDWIAGAPLMGIAVRPIERMLRRNARRADAVAVVSPPLLALVHDERRSAQRPEIVLPNGAPENGSHLGSGRRQPIAGLVGQLNERLDLGALEAVVDAGIPVRVVGAVAVRDSVTDARLRAVLQHPLVDWRGRVPAAEVASHLAEIAVGLTPYTRTAFNLSSSPLKTFEYLAAGVPVVSSDLPASSWMQNENVAVAADADEFVTAVRQFIGARDDDEAAQARRTLAGEHSWRMRARAMLDLIDGTDGGARVAAAGEGFG